MGKIIADYRSPEWRQQWNSLSSVNKTNGAYNYSKELVENIIPRVQTERPWVTVNQPWLCEDHAIVFMHSNLNPQNYDWFKVYKDIVMVVGVPGVVEVLKKRGHKQVVYLPLSVDREYVERFMVKRKTKQVAYAGRPEKRALGTLPEGIDLLEGLPRDELLKRMAKYRQIYAVGRCAIEAKILGCEILPFDHRYPDPSIWQVVDNCEAAEILQKELDKIDGTK